MLARTWKTIGVGIIPIILLFLFRYVNDSSAALYAQILISSLITTSILGLILFFKSKEEFCSHISLVKVTACFFLCYSLLSSTVLNIDRSRSFYVISWVNLNLIGVNKNSIDLTLVESSERLNQKAINARISEQTSNGNIQISGDRLVLTNQGKILYRLSSACAVLFKLNGWHSNER
jgi:hypothetical protein